MFKRLFLELLAQPAKPRNILGRRHIAQGSTGSTGRKHMNLLAKSNKTDPNYPQCLTRLKGSDSGVMLLNQREVNEIKNLYNLTDLETIGHRNLGNTGITIFLKDNKYYIKK
jgi:hypothetical protein